MDDTSWSQSTTMASSQESVRHPRLRQIPKVSYKNMENPLDQLVLEQYDDEDQPFDVIVHSLVLLSMDVHAHLAESEVIGLLGGYWDDRKKGLRVEVAYACKAITTTEDCSLNVEMDPISMLEITNTIKTKGMQVVGWYHSHPHFSVLPSVRDVENHLKFQTEWAESKLPFIGAIISPFNQARNVPVKSESVWFHVPNHDGDEVPYELTIEELKATVIAELTIEEQKATNVPYDYIVRMTRLVDGYLDFPHRTKFGEMWQGMTKRDKFVKSLLAHMPASSHPQNNMNYINMMLGSLFERNPRKRRRSSKSKASPVQAKRAKGRLAAEATGRAELTDIGFRTKGCTTSGTKLTTLALAAQAASPSLAPVIWDREHIIALCRQHYTFWDEKTSSQYNLPTDAARVGGWTVRCYDVFSTINRYFNPQWLTSENVACFSIGDDTKVAYFFGMQPKRLHLLAE